VGFTYNPLVYSGLVQSGGSGSDGVPIYSTISSFPLGAATGALGVAADTGIIYEFNGASWIVSGGSGVMLSVGPIDSVSPSNNGAVDSSNALIMQSASASFPGLVNTTTQTFVGQKTFSTGLTGTLTGHATLDIPLTEAGAANGVATLDSSGKIPAAQLPSTVLQYQGLWNPSTNTPTLQDSTGTNGYVYQVSAVHAGAISGLSNPTMVNFQIGNLIIFSNSVSQWEQTTPAAGVQSVNGAQGNVTVNAINQLTGDVTAGPASGSQSVAASLVATSNGTLVTLSALSLPGSQVTGNISGNAGNITATSNSTLTTLSSLSLSGTQVTGNISGNAANITATSNSTLTTLSSLSLPGPQVSGNITGNSAGFTGSLSGDVTGTQSATSIASTTVTGKLLTGYAAGSNTPLVATNSVLTAFENVQGQLNAITPFQLSGDIAQTSFTIANSQSAAANVTGLAFSNSSVESAQIQYSIVINATTSLYESGTIDIIQNSTGWNIAQEANFDNTNVIFSVTTSGQVQYTSPTYAGYSSGKMRFRALVTNV
jgi:hypothetical protein